MFLPAWVSSRLCESNGIGRLRKGGSEIAAEDWVTEPEAVERWDPEICCGLMRNPEGTALELLFAGSPTRKTGGAREQSIWACVGTKSPTSKAEVLNITIFEYTLTKNTAQPRLADVTANCDNRSFTSIKWLLKIFLATSNSLKISGSGTE
jgi:hypothetical protein